MTSTLPSRPGPRLPFPPLLLAGLLSLLTLAACGGPRPAVAPALSYKKLVRKAAADVAAGNYLAAADGYRRAYDRKPQKQDLAYRAAENYLRVNAYRRAADAFALVEPDDRSRPLLGLRYGRALKQNGRYAEARTVLTAFRDAYNGADRPIVTEIVSNELAGIRLVESAPPAAPGVDISRPGRGINTGADELGPVPVTGDELFFTSAQGGQSRLYRSRLQAGEWSKATVPPGFPVIAEGGFGTGSFTADGRAFFFTICSGATGEDATNRCEIFRGQRSIDGNWSQPRPLGPAINQPETNNAFPSIGTDRLGRTLLYFASDRPGGRGGMDLYVSVLPAGDDPLAFAPPLNLGPALNTVSDEVTPFYDATGGHLYFASNGHPGYGGLDVFRAAGDFNDFAAPENLGAPVNSAAEDHGLRLAAGSGRGYLTSNRRYEDEKTATTESDIFALNFRAGRARLKATVYDNTTGAELPGAEVVLLAIDPRGGERELERRTFSTGKYDFELQPGGRYRVIVRRRGYAETSYRVETSAGGSSLYGQPVFLRRQAGGAERPVPPDPALVPDPTPAPPPPAPAPPGLRVPTAEAPPPAAEPKAPAPVAYRIQISAARRFEPTSDRYAPVLRFGDLSSEPVPGKNLRRITVGYYTDAAAARQALEQVRRAGFPEAFAVRYDAGRRYGMVRL